MIVYGVRASEWETDYNCFCATKEIAEREKKRLMEQYSSDDDLDDCIDIDRFEVIDEQEIQISFEIFRLYTCQSVQGFSYGEW